MEKAEKKLKKKLFEIFESAPKNKLVIINPLIERYAFIKVQTELIEAKIRENGFISEYDNGGGQKGTKESAEARLHISYVKNMATIAKQLLDHVPNEVSKSKLEKFFNDVKK